MSAQATKGGASGPLADTMWAPEHLAFRQEVRDFCAERLPKDISDKVRKGYPVARDDHMRWQDILADKGWLAGFWPREYGGRGWGAAETFLFQQESSYAGAPWLIPMGVNYVGPVLYTYGSEDQKARHLPGIVSNKVFWCQGYSEPNAGSDLASLRTRAVRLGDHYVVNGSKIWTTMAQWADWIFCLVRTDTSVKPQAGISFLLIDLKSPGITISPIETIDGFSHLNQVFFEDVKVPVENLVGEENGGWTYGKFLLGHERVLSAEIGKARRFLDRLRAIAGANGKAESPAFRERVARFEVDILALEWTTLRVLDVILNNRSGGYEASVLKARGSTLLQSIAEYTADILGAGIIPYEPEMISQPEASLFDPEAMGIAHDFLAQRAPTIWGGSNEIQRNMIAKHALGL
jgi:alkylation response protein AidB-like acyl-CoA dehydrogenase